jgi:hypothetical protein
MRTVIVQYKVKPGREAENEELVKAVYAELAEAQPEGLRYATFVGPDGVSFTHIAEHDEGPAKLTDRAAFRRFVAELRDRCDEPPVTTELRQIGSYRLFSEAGEASLTS